MRLEKEVSKTAALTNGRFCGGLGYIPTCAWLPTRLPACHDVIVLLVNVDENTMPSTLRLAGRRGSGAGKLKYCASAMADAVFISTSCRQPVSAPSYDLRLVHVGLVNDADKNVRWIAMRQNALANSQGFS